MNACLVAYGRALQIHLIETNLTQNSARAEIFEYELDKESLRIEEGKQGERAIITTCATLNRI